MDILSDTLSLTPQQRLWQHCAANASDAVTAAVLNLLAHYADQNHLHVPETLTLYRKLQADHIVFSDQNEPIMPSMSLNGGQDHAQIAHMLLSGNPSGFPIDLAMINVTGLRLSTADGLADKTLHILAPGSEFGSLSLRGLHHLRLDAPYARFNAANIVDIPTKLIKKRPVSIADCRINGDLSHAMLEDINADNVAFHDMKLGHASIKNSRFDSCEFTSCDFDQLRFSGHTVFDYCHFTDCTNFESINSHHGGAAFYNCTFAPPEMEQTVMTKPNVTVVRSRAAATQNNTPDNKLACTILHPRRADAEALADELFAQKQAFNNGLRTRALGRFTARLLPEQKQKKLEKLRLRIVDGGRDQQPPEYLR